MKRVNYFLLRSLKLLKYNQKRNTISKRYNHIVDASGEWKDRNGRKFSIVDSDMPGAIQGLAKNKFGMPIHPSGKWTAAHSEEDYAVETGLMPVANFLGTFL